MKTVDAQVAPILLQRTADYWAALSLRAKVMLAVAMTLFVTLVSSVAQVSAAPQASAACRATSYAWGWKPAWYGKAYNWYPVGSGCPYFNRGW